MSRVCAMDTKYVGSESQGGEFAIWETPPGVVAIDVDEPEGVDVPHAQLLSLTKQFAAETSAEFGLGLFWLYHTLNGFHVLFEHVLPGHQEVIRLLDRLARRPAPTECEGHARHCYEDGHVQIRVGDKPNRPRDIWPVKGNPPATPYPHIWEHERLLAQELPAK